MYWSIALVVIAVSIGVSSTIIFKMKKDNKIEEIAEEIIKKETGIDVDLSPNSKETKE